ncbi:DUF3696 domain-containing protein [Lentimicrobium sp. L6]|uniref:AAA family ATPase n=1 Tax=Lentimicrobium sp. L6 TaxID=2735916 RepID=UPI0015560895|nr:DUF3696 domain-containing protein [Lentimicrobium sp. L6]NPD85433.1 DUF3696 domain-containing protein [Lentimicrobium sp. L6]
MLEHFGVKNFKVFSDLQELDLRPLTFLVGTNSSGKSSFTSSLRLFQENKDNVLSTSDFSSKKEFKNISLNFSTVSSIMGSFKSIINKNDLKKKLIFRLPVEWLSLPKSVYIELTFIYDADSKFEDALLEKIEAFDGNISIYVVELTDPKVYVLTNGGITEEENEAMKAPVFNAQLNISKIKEIIFSKIKEDIDSLNKHKEAADLYQIFIQELNGKDQFNFFENYKNNQSVAYSLLGTKALELWRTIEEYENYISIRYDKYPDNLNSPLFLHPELFDFSYGEGDYNLMCFVNGELLSNSGNEHSQLIAKYSRTDLLLNYCNEIASSFANDELLRFESNYFRKISQHNYLFREPIDYPGFDIEIGNELVDAFNSFFGTSYDKYSISNNTGNMDIFNLYVTKLSSSFETLKKELSFHFIPSIRSNNSRTFERNGNSYFEKIIKDYNIGDISDKKKQFFTKWLKEFGIAKGVDFKLIGTSGLIELELIEENGNYKNLLDVGYGFSQLLPLLMKVSLLGNDEQFVIEEPETNLHPALQSKLADFFVDAQKEFKYQFIIETHSEYLIRKIQSSVSKGVCSSSDISIYYFTHPDETMIGGEQVKKIRIAENGLLLDDFGEGFFDEADKIAMNLFQLTKGQYN